MKSMQRIIFLFITVFYCCFSYGETDISIKNVWINEAPPTMTVLAGYGLINNNSDDLLVLEKITSPVFSSIEIHKIIIKNNVSKMIKQDELNIEPNSSSEFTPGGMHMMLYEPQQAVRKDDVIPFIFHFSDGSEIKIDAIVKKLSESSHQHHHHHH